MFFSGYDMSTFIRRYSRYLNEKAFAYRQMSFDFGRVKKGYSFSFLFLCLIILVLLINFIFLLWIKKHHSLWVMNMFCVWGGVMPGAEINTLWVIPHKSLCLLHNQINVLVIRSSQGQNIPTMALDNKDTDDRIEYIVLYSFFSHCVSVSGLMERWGPCRWRSCWKECPRCRARSTHCWILMWVMLTNREQSLVTENPANCLSRLSVVAGSTITRGALM